MTTYKLALSRLHQLYNSLHKRPELWAKYCEIIDEQLRRNIVEDSPVTCTSKDRPVVEDSPVTRTLKDRPVYYIPHQAVFKTTSSTTKN